MSSSSNNIIQPLDIAHKIGDVPINKESDVSRITNELNSMPDLSRTNSAIQDFLEQNVLDNDSLSRNILGEKEAVNGLDDDPMARFDMRNVSLGAFLDKNGKLKPEFVEICQDFNLDAQQLIELIHTAFSTAWNLVADGDGKIHEYLLEHLDPTLYEPEGSKKYKKTLAQLLQGANQLIFAPLFRKRSHEMSEEETTFTGGLTLITDNQIAAILNDEDAFDNFKSFATTPLPGDFVPYVKPKRKGEERDIMEAAPRPVKQSSASKWLHRFIKGTLTAAFTVGTSLVGAGIGFAVGGPVWAAIGAGIGGAVGVAVAGGTWTLSSLWNRRSSEKRSRDYELVVSDHVSDKSYDKQHRFMSEMLVDSERKKHEDELRQRKKHQRKVGGKNDLSSLVIEPVLASTDEDSYKMSSSL